MTRERPLAPAILRHVVPGEAPRVPIRFPDPLYVDVESTVDSFPLSLQPIKRDVEGSALRRVGITPCPDHVKDAMTLARIHADVLHSREIQLTIYSLSQDLKICPEALQWAKATR
jgi:hypothetical protein